VFGSFVIKHTKELWARSYYHGNRNILVDKGTWSNSKINLLKHLVFHHYYTDLNTKRFFWTWPSCHVDRNMLVCMSAGSSWKTPLGAHSLSSSLVLLCCLYDVEWIMLFTFSLVTYQRLSLNIILKSSTHILWKALDGFYNFNCLKLWEVALHQSFRRFMLCLMLFWSV